LEKNGKYFSAYYALGSKIPEIYYCLGEIEQREHFCKTAIIAYKQVLSTGPGLPAGA
jgi:hypothetical protein